MFIKPDKNKILKIAKNLKLELNENELKEVEIHFDRIIPKINKLDEIDTNGIEPLEFNDACFGKLREDESEQNNIKLEEGNIKIIK
jgi:aspartyl/glutamyl-tRNA(Asn/Gln) amidotransferase C subunit